MSRFPRSSLRLRQEAPVTFWLIALSVAASVWTWLGVSDVDAFFQTYGLVPSRFLGEFGVGQLLTLASSAFLHGGLLHLAFNAMMLYFLGRLVEPTLGSRRFAAVYALATVAAGLAQIAWDPSSEVPMVGASGAISGVFGAALVLAPQVRLLVMTPFTLFIPIAMKLRTFALIWVGLQVAGLAFEDWLGGGIAYTAHLGGFAAGWLALAGVRSWVSLQRTAARVAYAARVRYGPAPDPRFRTFYVTDRSGQTFAFHEPA